ncbi:MAG TPA: double-strand break repair protein AddB [Stellaceae bacterium]|nr:double-strand break repair protein AddB [Stellaceae bacterium]
MPLKLYTLAPERPFLAILARGLLAMSGSDALALSRITVLLPTRRAARSLRDAFLRTNPGGKEPGTPLLLPRMRPIGDLDSDELALAEGIGDSGDLSIPPTIPELRRRLLLTQLVQKWGRRGRRDPLLPGQAAALAGSLARLLDTVASEGASFARLRDLAPPDLAEHWEIVCEFLEILPKAWPAILAAEGALDPSDRRNRLLARQAAIWQRTPPRDPIVAAGLTGGIPAMTELIRVVASLESGTVILHGLDRRCGASEWEAIEQDEAHPQYLIAGLLRSLELAPADVRDWPAQSLRDGGSPRARRLRLVGEAMRPAPTTDAWRDLPECSADTLDGVSRYDCAGAHEEALTIALLLRRKLETPGATAALVTPDRELARRVAAELARWGIAIDDTAGLPLNRTPPGVFLRLVLDLAASELAPVPLLAALKHPLAAGGLAPAAFRDLTRRLEQAIRGPRPAPGFAGLRDAVAGKNDERLQAFIGRLRACLGALPDLLAADAAPLDRLATAHIEAAERLAATDDETGADRLWREAAGETAARFYNELIDAAGDFPPLPGRHYPALYETLAVGAVVRSLYGRHPRLAIWGLVEARLQQADLVVLGGLDEGIWPGPAAHDPWMSRQMRREFKIAVPERAIGIAAHDFVQAIAAPEAALTRAARKEGVPTVPSRWLLRLDTVLRAVGLADALGPDPAIQATVDGLDAAQYEPLPPAAPRPPLAARPRRLSVTQIETWLGDPYAIYARHILQLKALDELDADPGRADLGICIHAALAEFVRRFPRGLPEDPQAELLAIARRHFATVLSRPGAWAFWWPRFERIVDWLVMEETAHRATTVESFSERDGRLTLSGFPGGSFELTAKADRIDRLGSGAFLLIDYKTGALPKKATIRDGFAPQLPLEAAILRDGGFGEVTGTPAALEYWKLGGRAPAGRRCPIDDGKPAMLVERVLAKLRALIARFDDPETPYLAVPAATRRPRFSDYEHLERVGRGEVEEW